jgi:tRNA (mo5U34)-methyltransferase
MRTRPFNTVRAMTQTLAAEVADYPWYHTLELGDGVVTQGMFDHRPVLEHYPLPKDLSGLRCADIGTMDGFWAFEMERRGAAEVVAVDAPDPLSLDWPASLRHTAQKKMDETKEERFALAHRALGSNVRRVLCTVYDIDPGRLGSFDIVFCGDLLVHLRDPVGALERIHAITSGSAIVTNPIERFGLRDRRPVARLDGIDEFGWWHTNEAGLVRMVRAAGFQRVDPSSPFKLPFASGGGWKGLRGVVRAYP